MLSTWSRDPFRVFEDVAGDMMDPFNTAFGGDYGNRGWDRRRMPQVTSRLTCMDAWEADDKFKVRLEVNIGLFGRIARMT